MNEIELITLVEEILEVEAGTVKVEASLDDLEWDSLANISFIAEIDSRLGKTVDADALNACKTVKELGALVAGA